MPHTSSRSASRVPSPSGGERPRCNAASSSIRDGPRPVPAAQTAPAHLIIPGPRRETVRGFERSNEPGRNARDERPRSDVLEDDGSRTDHGASPDTNTRADDRARGDPHMVLDHDGSGAMDTRHHLRHELSRMELDVSGEMDVRADPDRVAELEVDAFVQRRAGADAESARISDQRDAPEKVDVRMETGALRAPERQTGTRRRAAHTLVRPGDHREGPRRFLRHRRSPDTSTIRREALMPMSAPYRPSSNLLRTTASGRTCAKTEVAKRTQAAPTAPAAGTTRRYPTSEIAATSRLTIVQSLTSPSVKTSGLTHRKANQTASSNTITCAIEPAGAYAAPASVRTAHGVSGIATSPSAASGTDTCVAARVASSRSSRGLPAPTRLNR